MRTRSARSARGAQTRQVTTPSVPASAPQRLAMPFAMSFPYRHRTRFEYCQIAQSDADLPAPPIRLQSPGMVELGVNIDHVATLRQARRTYEPDPVWAAAEAELGGADGITIHLREDRRHINDRDVQALRQA